MTSNDGTDEGGRGGVLARLLLAETREEILKADQKAGLVLSGLGVALTVLLSALGEGHIAPLHYGPAAQVIFWSGCAASLPALGLLGLAIMPRLGASVVNRTHYFGDIDRRVSLRLLTVVVQQTDPLERDLSQFAMLSRVVAAKYRCIRCGMGWSGLFLLLTALGVLMGSLA